MIRVVLLRDHGLFAKGDVVSYDPVSAKALFAAGIAKPAEQEPIAADETAPFDPSHHTVEEVNSHLLTADAAEQERVLTLEAGGKNRTGVTTP